MCSKSVLSVYMFSLQEFSVKKQHHYLAEIKCTVCVAVFSNQHFQVSFLCFAVIMVTGTSAAKIYHTAQHGIYG